MCVVRLHLHKCKYCPSDGSSDDFHLQKKIKVSPRFGIYFPNENNQSLDWHSNSFSVLKRKTTEERKGKRKERERKALLSLERTYKDEATHESLDFSFQTMIRARWNMKKSTKLNFSTLSADHWSKLCEQHQHSRSRQQSVGVVGGAGEPSDSYALCWWLKQMD